TTDDIARKITIEGAMDTRDRKCSGRLAIEGASLTFFKTDIDSLAAKVNLKGTELEIEQLEIKRRDDSLSGEGKIDMSGDHSYSGTLDARADKLLDYFFSVRGATGKTADRIPVDVQATINANNWDAPAVIRDPDPN